MAQELRDLFEGAQFTLDESKSQKFEGVLATVKGPFGLTEDSNRNGRIYTNEFWKHVLGKKETQSRIAERAVIGELEHPNSIQTQLGHISHVVTDLKVIPESKELYGEADILDTPSGRILHTLFKAGVKVGISSRGAGSLVEEGTGESKKKYVKKEDYVFGGFDFVSDPSAPNAFPKLAEGQIAALIEGLASHSGEIEKDTTGFYDSFLTGLGVPLSEKEEPKVEVQSEDTTFDEEADLDEQAATISDLRSKMRQMVERHREMSSQVAELSEQVEERDDLVLRCETLSEAVHVHKSKALELGQRMDEITSDLAQARERLDEFKEMDIENMRGAVLRERELSKGIARLEGELQEAKKEIEAHVKRAETLEVDLSTKEDLVESKRGKLETFRRGLLKALSEHFNCDFKALTEGLKPGFTPEDAVSRAAECSRSLHTSSLPLGEGQSLQVEDMIPTGGADAQKKTAIKEGRKRTIRGVRGRKN